MVKQIDENLIQEKIGAGFQHVVYAYGKDHVIKIPRLWMRFSAGYTHKERELEIAQFHIGNFFPETTLHHYKSSYCYVQKRIRNYTMLLLSNTYEYVEITQELNQRNKEMIAKHSMSVDFLSSQTLIDLVRRLFVNTKVHNGNLVAHPDAVHGVYLLDTDLLRTHPFAFHSFREIIFTFLSLGMYVANMLVIKAYKLF